MKAPQSDEGTITIAVRRVHMVGHGLVIHIVGHGLVIHIVGGIGHGLEVPQ